MKSTIRTTVILLGVSMLLTGCNDAELQIAGNMQADFNHDHRHQHGAGHDHEHQHSSTFSGGHSHPHMHGHRHGEPIYGGRIVSIGHTHHGKGATHYHAEVMPIIDGQITFHVLLEDEKGESVECPIDEPVVVAYVDQADSPSGTISEIEFKSSDPKGGSSFVADVPERCLDFKEISVVVPKIQIGKNRQSFSFTAKTASEIKPRDESDNSDQEEASS